MGRRAAKNAARKGKSDALKTKIYASYGKKLVMAVKAGGPEPDVNRALAVLIREAKAQGVPTDNVQRAIQRGKHIWDGGSRDMWGEKETGASNLVYKLKGRLCNISCIIPF